MKALSGRQPWWWAILHAGKRVENRISASSATMQLRTFREPFLLHASKGVGTRREFHESVECVQNMLLLGVGGELAWRAFRDECLVGDERCWLPGPGLKRGGIIGVARCVGIVASDGRPADRGAVEAISRYAVDLGWHAPGQVGHILADVRPLPFVECDGMLGLWDVPDELARLAMGTAHVEFKPQRDMFPPKAGAL